ncbi:MAG: hypothetical protein KC419_12155 [Anaerolineales bacterium]|nr:hypothetical protein [Anaerolineales bacterium]MCA9929231.1 hypothetical protein [Anaerolineales bacterium]
MSKLQHLWHKIEGEALYRYNRLVSGTARWQVDGQENIDKAKASGRPLLWTYWHEHVTSFIMFGDRFEKAKNFSVIMVGDERSTILGRLGTRLGANMYGIDMQGNPVASGRMLLRVIQAMKKGRQTILAPDGPDGPAHEPKGGVAYIARKAEAAIIPIATHATPAYHMKRWDNHEVALPFSKIRIFIAPPIMPDKKNTDDASLLQEITQALNGIHLKSKRYSE